jgi:hypothetical protein
VRGDCDGDGRGTSLSDVVFLLRWLFTAGRAPPCLAACDADGDGQVSGRVTDAVYALTYLFRGGPSPPPPFPGCGPPASASDVALGCGLAPPGCR